MTRAMCNYDPSRFGGVHRSSQGSRISPVQNAAKNRGKSSTKERPEIVKIGGKTAFDAFTDHADRVVRVEGLQVGASDLEVLDFPIPVELLIKQAGRVLDKLHVGAVEFGEGLLVLAFDDHLSLGVKRRKAVGMHVFDPDFAAFDLLQKDPRLAPLRMRNRIDAAL